MPKSIKSLLTTHPFKLKTSLEHICSKLKLPTDGTVPLLRKRILTHVKENRSSEERVRKISMDYKIKHPKTPNHKRPRSEKMVHPLSPLVRVGNQTQPNSSTATAQQASPQATSVKQIFSQPFSQPDLFAESQENGNRRLSIAEVTQKIDEFSEILQLEGIADKLISDDDNENEVSDDDDDDCDDDDENESYIEDDVFHATENARFPYVQSPFTHLEQSFWYENGLKENAFVLIDKRIQSLQEHFDKSIRSLTLKHEEEINKIGQKLNQANDCMKILRDDHRDKEKHLQKQISELSDQVKALQNKQPHLLPNPAISTAPLEIEMISSPEIEIPQTEAITTQAITVNHGLESNVSPTQATANNGVLPLPANEAIPSQDPSPPTNEPSSTDNQVSNPPNPQELPRKKPDIIVIADSNGKYLDPKLLHDHKNVTIEKRYFINKAKNEIPVHNDPENVSDIVMLTGINDLKYDDIPVVLNKLDQTCHRYQSAFPNSKIHIGGVAPANPKCIQYNFHLENLADERQVPFIPNDELIDASTGVAKTGMVEPNDIHYTKKGLRTYAKHIKRSLYGYKRRQNIPRPNPPSGSPPIHPSNSPSLNQNHAQFIHPGQVHAIKNLFNMALSFLPNQLY